MSGNGRLATGVTLLLVDDDDVDVISVKRALKKLNINNPLIRAHDGIEALDILRREEALTHSCLILLDINMPRMNGLEFLAALRNDPKLASSLVFVLTTSSADEDVAGAYSKNVAGYLVKSRVAEEFTGLVEKLSDYWRLIELPLHR
ncbi:response regulator [Exilibacterium tricleocarpae]|uniref:Response regulator n=2 Tax=Exilibacterium tricleocarpae TaxID=2591008 RepID=A0A545T8M5_9GAMM|nr:response regulator [Exilibacterium tricleocarpae]